MVAASFLLGAPPSPPPVRAGTPANPGRAIQFFGVSPANPAVVSTKGNSPQTFTFDTTSTGGVRVLWRYADDANFLGRTAMPGQLLVMPGFGWFDGRQYFVCASGTIIIPLSAQNSGVSFTLFQNNFVNTALSGLNIQATSLPLVTLPNMPLQANLNSYQWSVVASIGGAIGGNAISAAAIWNINGVIINAGGSATGASDEEATGPKLQMSLAAQFAGTVSGSDQFQATCSQFEIQEI